MVLYKLKTLKSEFLGTNVPAGTNKYIIVPCVTPVKSISSYCHGKPWQTSSSVAHAQRKRNTWNEKGVKSAQLWSQNLCVNLFVYYIVGISGVGVNSVFSTCPIYTRIISGISHKQLNVILIACIHHTVFWLHVVIHVTTRICLKGLVS